MHKIRKYLWLWLLYLVTLPAFADVTSYKVCGTVTEDTSVGTDTILNPSNATGTGATVATIDWASGTKSSSRIKVTNCGFTSSDIPASSTIDGIEFSYARQENGITDNLFTYEIYHIDASGTLQTGTNSADAGEWNTGALSTVTVGGATNLMGYAGATQANMLDADWGISFRAWTGGGSGSTPDGTFNAFKVRVYFTPPSGTPDPDSTDIIVGY